MLVSSRDSYKGYQRTGPDPKHIYKSGRIDETHYRSIYIIIYKFTLISKLNKYVPRKS